MTGKELALSLLARATKCIEEGQYTDFALLLINKQAEECAIVHTNNIDVQAAGLLLLRHECETEDPPDVN